jgi:hypothetical protein
VTTEQNPTPDPVVPGAPAPAAQNSDTGGDKRYAAYDTTYGKFLPGVYDSKKKATDAAKALKGDAANKVGDVEVREV